MKRFTVREQQSKGSKILAGLSCSFILATIGAPLLPSPQVTLPKEILGVAAEGVEPKLCIGYNEMKQRWGADYGYCPASHAFYGVDDPAGKSGPAEHISVSMACCELPAKDMLTEEHSFSTSTCPSDSIVTGSRRIDVGDDTIVEMRCTKINLARYQLGEPTRGVYWGEGAAGWRGSERIAWENIPAAMRFAHGRQTQDKWDVDGCVGFPWGSVLTKKESKDCGSFTFQQLQYSGNASDPARGTPVQMLPRCSNVENVESPDAARCHS